MTKLSPRFLETLERAIAAAPDAAAQLAAGELRKKYLEPEGPLPACARCKHAIWNIHPTTPTQATTQAGLRAFPAHCMLLVPVLGELPPPLHCSHEQAQVEGEGTAEATWA